MTTKTKTAKTTSPIPALLDFPDAMRAVMNGREVTKQEWGDRNIYVFLSGRLKINKPEGVFDLIFSDGDVLGKDWIIL